MHEGTRISCNNRSCSVSSVSLWCNDPSDGGEGGIRTHEAFHRLHDFQSCLVSHSSTSPASNQPSAVSHQPRGVLVWRSHDLSENSAPKATVRKLTADG